MGVFGVVPGPGTDNTGPPLSNANPVNVDNTAAAPGVSTDASRADHHHDVNFGTPVTVTASTNGAGVATTLALSDHQHALGLIVQDAGVLVGTRAALNFTGATVADDAGNNRVNITVVATPLSVVAPVNVDNTAAAVGVSTSAARADHHHDVNFGTPGTIAPDDTADAGTATTLALSDHRHAIVAATAIEISDSTSNEGVSTSFARADHLHAHGNRGGGTLHAVATTSVAGFMSAADKALSDNQDFLVKTPGAYPYTGLTADNVILVSSTSARTINLPDPALYVHKILAIKDAAGLADSFPITIARFGSELIDGYAANYTLALAWGSTQLCSDGTNWFTIGDSRYLDYPFQAPGLRALYYMRQAPYSTQSGGAFTDLYDQVTGLNFNQTTAADRPTLTTTGGFGSADFASSDALIGNMTPNQWTRLVNASAAVTIYGVFVADSLVADNAGAPWVPPSPLGEATGYTGARLSASGLYGFLFDAAAKVTGYVAVSTGTVYGFRYSYDGTTMTVKLNGTEATVAAAAPGSLSGIPRMGFTYTGGGGASFDGRIPVLSLYTNVLNINTPMETAISKFFTSRYGAVAI